MKVVHSVSASVCPGEDHFLSAVINDVNGAAIQFRLAPAYTLYMSLRSRVWRPTRPDLSVLERDKSVNSFANKVVWHISQLVQVSPAINLAFCCQASVT